jgi:hypothetical protein
VLTVFGVPKPFSGRSDLIQRNAAESWKALGADVLLLGDEEHVADAATQLGVTHLPELARNEYGTPLLDAAFAAAESESVDRVLCYANCDVMLPPTLTRAVEAVVASHERFLLVGRCADVEPPEDFDPQDKDWATRLARDARVRGHDYLDWFVFTRGLFDGMPSFALGRAAFDNWLVWKARASGAPVIDASPVFVAIHQRHDHSHVAGGADWAYSGPEAKRNVELAGGATHLFTLLDATHALDADMHVGRRRGSIGRFSHRRHRARLALGRLRARLSP